MLSSVQPVLRTLSRCVCNASRRGPVGSKHTTLTQTCAHSHKRLQRTVDIVKSRVADHNDVNCCWEVEASVRCVARPALCRGPVPRPLCTSVFTRSTGQRGGRRIINAPNWRSSTIRHGCEDAYEAELRRRLRASCLQSSFSGCCRYVLTLFVAHVCHQSHDREFVFAVSASLLDPGFLAGSLLRKYIIPTLD